MRSVGADLAAVLSGSWRPLVAPTNATPDEILVERLLAGGCGGLAWRRVESAATADRYRQLRDAFRLTMLHGRIREAQLESCFGALGRAGLSAVLGKGWAVARLYPSFGLRPTGDIDLYVEPASYEQVQRVLSSAGSDWPVDLHRGFAELDDRSPEELQARSEVQRVGDAEVRVFGPEDHLRLLCLHLLRHGALRPLWLCDVALVLESRPKSFDWQAFLEGEPWRTEAAILALGLAHSVLGASLEDVPFRERAMALPPWLAREVAREWSRGRPPHGARTPLGLEARHPARWRRALTTRWPNGIEAGFALGAPWRGMPRLPLKLAAAFKRSLALLPRRTSVVE